MQQFNFGSSISKLGYLRVRYRDSPRRRSQTPQEPNLDAPTGKNLPHDQTERNKRTCPIEVLQLRNVARLKRSFQSGGIPELLNVAKGSVLSREDRLPFSEDRLRGNVRFLGHSGKDVREIGNRDI